MTSDVQVSQPPELPRSLRFSPWTFTPVAAALLSVLMAYVGWWAFLEAVHPVLLGAVAVLLTFWLLLALIPKLTVHAMRQVDFALPRGDSAVPAVGVVLRLLTALLGPALLYVSLMALREDVPAIAEYAGAAAVGLALGAVGWRSVTLLDIMRETYPEDEIRKGLLDTGVYNKEASRKLEQAAEEIDRERNFDKKRIRLRRLAATARVLRNKNYDPHQFEHGTTSSATVAGLGREGDVRRARKGRDRVEREADLEDAKLDAAIAEQQSLRKYFDGLVEGDSGVAQRRSLEQKIRRQFTDFSEKEALIYEERDRAIERVTKRRPEDELTEEELRRIENIRDFADSLLSDGW